MSGSDIIAELLAQKREGENREAFGGGYAPIAEDGPFTEESATDEGDQWATFQGIPVEVVDPDGSEHPANLIHFREGVTRLKRRVDTETFEDTVQEVFDEAFDIMIARQKKYGPDNVRKAGLYGLFTRLEDKMERIKRDLNGQIVNGEIILEDPPDLPDEAVDDADFDGMNYHAIRILVRRGKWGKPLAADVGIEA